MPSVFKGCFAAQGPRTFGLMVLLSAVATISLTTNLGFPESRASSGRAVSRPRPDIHLIAPTKRGSVTNQEYNKRTSFLLATRLQRQPAFRQKIHLLSSSEKSCIAML